MDSNLSVCGGKTTNCCSLYSLLQLSLAVIKKFEESHESTSVIFSISDQDSKSCYEKTCQVDILITNNKHSKLVVSFKGMSFNQSTEQIFIFFS